MTIPRLYPVAERDWLRAKWAIHPAVCEKCGARKAVVWVLSVEREWWLVRCRACDPSLSVQVADWHVDHADVVLIVREIPALSDQSEDAPDIEIAAASGGPMRAGLLARVAESFHNLARARLSWATNPPVKWALERREDGRVWAPWDLWGGTWRRSEALPLRTSVLREAGKVRREQHKAAMALAPSRALPCQCDVCTGKPPVERRQCFGCKVTLGVGQTAWRADTTGHADKAGWSSDGLAVLWCPSCVAAVQVIAEAAPEETVVRHVRVIEGGNTARVAPVPES